MYQKQAKDYYCNVCNSSISQKIADYSWDHYKRFLCLDHQKEGVNIRKVDGQKPKEENERMKDGETTKLRREIDLYLGALAGAISLASSGKIEVKQIPIMVGELVVLKAKLPQITGEIAREQQEAEEKARSKLPKELKISAREEK